MMSGRGVIYLILMATVVKVMSAPSCHHHIGHVNIPRISDSCGEDNTYQVGFTCYLLSDSRSTWRDLRGNCLAMGLEPAHPRLKNLDELITKIREDTKEDFFLGGVSDIDLRMCFGYERSGRLLTELNCDYKRKYVCQALKKY